MLFVKNAGLEEIYTVTVVSSFSFPITPCRVWNECSTSLDLISTVKWQTSGFQRSFMDTISKFLEPEVFLCEI